MIPHILTKSMTFNSPVVEAIKNSIGRHPAERGGMLGTNTHDNRITHFEPDTLARCTPGAYDPDLPSMNAVISQWKKQKIRFCGFVHSHPAGVRQLSAPDEWYSGELLTAFPKLERLFLPIVMTIPDTGRFEILPFIVEPESENRKLVVISLGRFEVRPAQGGVTQEADSEQPNLIKRVDCEVSRE